MLMSVFLATEGKIFACFARNARHEGCNSKQEHGEHYFGIFSVCHPTSKSHYNMPCYIATQFK